MTTEEWQIRRNPAPATPERRAEILSDPGFGRYFTDHMVDWRWTEGEGWHDPRVVPYGPISIEPAAAVLHYAQEVFEGLKAYRHPDGSVHAFRPEQNAQRLQRSTRRLALPELATEPFVESIRQLVAVDEIWIASHAETSLYLRPFMWASEGFLGVRPAREVTFNVIASPAGAYFSSGPQPLSIWLSTTWTRAGRGGLGAAKTGGNYAASLLPQQEAYDNGCSQVLFLDAQEGRYLEELGGMNIVLVTRENTLISPDSGSILEGITLDSISRLALDRGYAVERRPVSIDEWREGAASGEFVEAFVCGTGAGLAPIARIRSPDFDIVMPEPEGVHLSMLLRRELTDIQHGRVPDRHGWLTRLL